MQIDHYTIDHLVSCFYQNLQPYELSRIQDNHQDHIAISRAFAKAYKNKAVEAMVYAYSVWTTLIPNVVIDISQQWEQKKQAIDCYKTQTATRDYVTMAESISKYWSVVKGKDTQYCEAFFRATSDEYVSLVKKIL